MRKLIRRLKLVFSYGPELEDMLFERKLEREKQEAEARKDNLNLCFRHQQERNHSHYSEDNCDYCKLLRLTNEIADPS